MRINSHYIGEVAKDILNRLNELDEKITFLGQEELKKYRGSNFCFDLDKNELTWLVKISRVLLERENISVNSDIEKSLNDKIHIYIVNFQEFNNLLDSIYKSENGSIDQSFFYSPFFSFIKELIFLIKDVYQSFLDKFDLEDILKSKEKYEKLQKQAEITNNNSNLFYEKLEKKGNDLILRFEQIVTNKEVIDIKTYYSALITKIEKERTLYGFLYGVSIVAFIIGLIIIFIFSECLYKNTIFIPRSVITITFIGFISFIINDFRKRFNIDKQILDELYQKKIIVDTYSRLSIKNHGYLSKQINSEIPNVVNEIIDRINSTIKKDN